MHRCLGTCLIAQWRLKKDASKNRAKLKKSLLLARIFRAMRPFGAVQRAKTARLGSRAMHQKSAAMPRCSAGGLLDRWH